MYRKQTRSVAIPDGAPLSVPKSAMVDQLVKLERRCFLGTYKLVPPR